MESKHALNAAIRGRLTGQPAQTANVPDSVAQAVEATQAALASGDADAIIAADDALTSAINTASKPEPKRTWSGDWGQGSRGTRSASPATMSDRIRAAAAPNTHPAHASPGAGGRIN